jgi:multiple sugar transport system permease protein
VTSATIRVWRHRTVAVHVALIGISVLALLPFAWMVSTSLKTLENTMASPPQWLPDPVRWANYADIFRDPKANFLLWTRNTLVIAVLGVAGTTLSSALVAYAFAKIRFVGRGPLFALMLSTMMIPFPVTMVSLFTIFKWLGDHTGMDWLGTFKPLWVPAWFGSAFNIFLLRQFFLTIPNELSEAARIDGCNELGIFWRIILPLSRPALAVVALFAFMAIWNDFLGPLIYLQRPEQFTLSLGLQNYQSKGGGTSWHLLMAASTLVVLPVLVLFFLAQRTFIEGIATTGSKG